MKKINEFKKDLIDLALKVGEYYKIKLDFSIDSVKRVEEILSYVNNDYKKNDKYEGINGLSLEFAAYIVEVIEKNIVVGEWKRDSREFGKETFPYDLGNGDIIFPYTWCLKRIYEGETEIIWFKFKSLVLDKNHSLMK